MLKTEKNLQVYERKKMITQNETKGQDFSATLEAQRQGNSAFKKLRKKLSIQKWITCIFKVDTEEKFSQKRRNGLQAMNSAINEIGSKDFGHKLKQDKMICLDGGGLK